MIFITQQDVDKHLYSYAGNLFIANMPEFRGRKVTGVATQDERSILRLYCNNQSKIALLNEDETSAIKAIIATSQSRIDKASKVINFLRFNGWDNTGNFVSFAPSHIHDLGIHGHTNHRVLVSVYDSHHAKELFGYHYAQIIDTLKPNMLSRYTDGIIELYS